jgi:CheY-like chemotaxis protein
MARHAQARGVIVGRGQEALPDLPVMMVTAYGDDDRRRRASELGAFEFLTKPDDFDRLRVQLGQVPAAPA